MRVVVNLVRDEDFKVFFVFFPFVIKYLLWLDGEKGS